MRPYMIISDMKTILHQLKDVLISRCQYWRLEMEHLLFNQIPNYTTLHKTIQWIWGSCSSCSEEKSLMVSNPDPKQYWNNWKNDMSLFSTTNQERPYEQLLYTQPKSEVSLNLNSLVLNSSRQLNRSTKDSFIHKYRREVSEFEFKTIHTVAVTGLLLTGICEYIYLWLRLTLYKWSLSASIQRRRRILHWTIRHSLKTNKRKRFRNYLCFVNKTAKWDKWS